MHAWTLYAREPGDLNGTRQAVYTAGRSGKAGGRNPGMYTTVESNIGILLKKVPNKVLPPSGMAEVPEGRPVTEGNSGKKATTCTQRQG